MNILLGSYGKLDFDAPVPMTNEQREKFLEFMKTEFEPLEVKFDDDFRTDRLGDKARFMSYWTKKEYAMLLVPRGNDYLEDKMARTWMSIVMKRMTFLPDFETWLNKNGLHLKEANEDSIDKYLKELEEESLLKAQQRRANEPVYTCPECKRYYDSARMTDNSISMRKTCDYDGAVLKEDQISKNRIPVLKSEGKYSKKYDNFGKPVG